MNDEEIIERIISLNYREFGAEVGNDLKRIIIKKEQKEQQLQSNWNSLRERLKDNPNVALYGDGKDFKTYIELQKVLDEMNELEVKDKE